jgi:hypothetical protein
MTFAVHLVFALKQGNQTAKAISKIYVCLAGIYQTKQLYIKYVYIKRQEEK